MRTLDPTGGLGDTHTKQNPCAYLYRRRHTGEFQLNIPTYCFRYLLHVGIEEGQPATKLPLDYNLTLASHAPFSQK